MMPTPDTEIDDSLFPDHARDEKRHKDRIREKLREGISDILKRRDIITGPTDRRVRIPIRSDEDPILHTVPKQNPNEDESEEPVQGIGQGSSKPGQGVGWIPRRRGKGSGRDAGNEGHEPEYIVEMSIDELAEWVFSELNLPVITPKRSPREPEETLKLNARHKKGEMSRLDKKDSLMRHLRRQIATGDETWYDDDLRFRQFKVEEHPGLDAVVVFVRDASGSMGEEESQTVYLAAWWTVAWLRHNYPRVTTRFIIHGTEAIEVSEEGFFGFGGMGGTIISSGLKLASEILEKDHPNANSYVLFFSDGENWGSDNDEVVRLVRKLATTAELVGYGEIAYEDTPVGFGTRLSNLWAALHNDIRQHGVIENFRGAKLQASNIRNYLLHMFGPKSAPVGAGDQKNRDSWNLALPESG